ncbi:MAG: sulfite exporter TauE/SafE family protein [Gammaproteobacteria bacterium]|nr:sulfite exporter TauE/SafE family protein [Gammaproteobacteria bacterium]MBU2478332.1 sulfite exporter TauE/SafE family protein [Gammaproteobacteria bacterium]
MLMDVSLLSAMLIGFFGGVHCVGMCGGIVGALTFGLPETLRQRPLSAWPFHLAYNLGRIASYAVAGALAGGVGGLVLHFTELHQAQQILQIIAALFMFALGLYLGGWWSGLVRIEQLGQLLWRRMEPIGRRFLPVATPTQAFALGLVWGWLPCGLVYSVLIWSLTAGSALEGAQLMLSFGIGTLPNLLLMGVLAAKLGQFMHQPWPRRVAGGLVMLFAMVLLARVFSG